MANREAGETRPYVASQTTGRVDVHLAELYDVQPLPDDFMRLALAVGESCQRAADKPGGSGFSLRYVLRSVAGRRRR